MPVFTEFKWKVDNFEKYKYGWSRPFKLKGTKDSKLSARIGGYDEISLRCENMGQAGELKVISKFWIKCGSNKFCERVKACAFDQNGQLSEPFLEKSDLADLQTSAFGKDVTICFKIALGDSVNDFDEEEATPNAIEPEQAGIDLSTEPQYSNESEVIPTEPKLLEELALNIGKRYLNGYHDLIIQAGGKEFKAVKTVLMAHSPVFELMLSSDKFVEAQGNVIQIEEIRGVPKEKDKAEVIEAFLTWMHFLKLEKLDNISENLYKAACKYQIYPLKKICTQSMLKTLNARNLPLRVILAYMFRVEDLMCYIIRFVQKYPQSFGDFVVSHEWSEFRSSNLKKAKRIDDAFSMYIADELCK